jgi:hypothetical protein
MIHCLDWYSVVRWDTLPRANRSLLIGLHHWWGVLAVAALPLLQLVHWWCLVAILVAILADLFVGRLLELLCRTQGPYQVSNIMLGQSLLW